MYDELVKRLRERGEFLIVSDRMKAPPNVNVRNVFAEDYAQAADAIEELQSDNAALNGTVSNLIQQIAELSKPRWIPATEALPIGGDDSGAICENVCLLLDDGTVSCGWMNGITKKAYYLNARDDFIIKAPITRVTHWMPLPEPPEEVDT